MRILSLDTTSRIATVAVSEDGKCLLELTGDETKKHAETAAPLIGRALCESGTSRAQIDLLAVDVGPGSFTGVRIGVSIVNAMAFALDRPVVGVDALYALYLAAAEPDKPVCTLIDARNQNAYVALFRAGKTILAPDVAPIDAYLDALPADTLRIGDIAADCVTYPRARYVAQAAFAARDAAKASVEPVYLRLSQAERLKRENGGERA